MKTKSARPTKRNRKIADRAFRPNPDWKNATHETQFGTLSEQQPNPTAPPQAEPKPVDPFDTSLLKLSTKVISGRLLRAYGWQQGPGNVDKFVSRMDPAASLVRGVRKLLITAGKIELPEVAFYIEGKGCIGVFNSVYGLAKFLDAHRRYYLRRCAATEASLYAVVHAHVNPSVMFLNHLTSL